MWNRRIATVAMGSLLGLVVLGSSGGCNELEQNPRTWGTIGGAAAGAAIGAGVDDDQPVRGALIGGAVGGAAGDVGGKIYKDNR